MKSFSQFLQESYLSDGVDPSQSKSFLVRQREKLRQQRAIPGQDLRREAEQVAQQASRRPQGTTTTVPSSSVSAPSTLPSSTGLRNAVGATELSNLQGKGQSISQQIRQGKPPTPSTTSTGLRNAVGATELSNLQGKGQSISQQIRQGKPPTPTSSSTGLRNAVGATELSNLQGKGQSISQQIKQGKPPSGPTPTSSSTGLRNAVGATELSNLQGKGQSISQQIKQGKPPTPTSSSTGLRNAVGATELSNLQGKGQSISQQIKQGKPPSGPTPTSSSTGLRNAVGATELSNLQGKGQSISQQIRQGKPPTTSNPTPTPNTPTSPRSTLRGRLFRGGLGALSAVDAVDAAKRGDTKGAIESGLLAAASSNRLNQGAARLGQRAVQGAATRLGMRTAGQVAARFVPGLQTAYGLARGTSALNKGDYLGAALGYGSALPVVGGVAAAADIARDVIDDPNQRYKRIATSGLRSARQIGAQSGKFGTRYGSAISGSGGPTTVNRKAGTITSGGRTAQLGSTQLIRDPKTGKQVVGDLAYKGGKAVYLTRPSVASRDTSLLSRWSRWSGIGGQRDADAAAAKREYRTALANTQRYQKQIRGKR